MQYFCCILVLLLVRCCLSHGQTYICNSTQPCTSPIVCNDQDIDCKIQCNSANVCENFEVFVSQSSNNILELTCNDDRACQGMTVISYRHAYIECLERNEVKDYSCLDTDFTVINQANVTNRYESTLECEKLQCGNIQFYCDDNYYCGMFCRGEKGCRDYWYEFWCRNAINYKLGGVSTAYVCVHVFHRCISCILCIL